jgi:hypothetical protein
MIWYDIRGVTSGSKWEELRVGFWLLASGFCGFVVCGLWFVVSGSGWLGLALAGSGWLWLALVGSGCLWLALAGSGWLWLALAESGWLWLALAGSGWF